VSVPSSGTILYKGLTVVASSPSTGQLLAGSITITVPKDDKGAATALNATAGTAVVVPVDTGGAGYTVETDAVGVDNNAEIFYSANDGLKYQATGGSAVTVAAADFSAVFNADLIAVLGALTTGDTVTFANGVITAATFTIAPDAAAKLQAVLNYAGETTLGGSGTTTTISAAVAVPAGKTLVVDAGNTLTVGTGITLTVNPGATLTFGAAGIIDASAGTVVAGDATNSVTLAKATYTAAGGTGSTVVAAAAPGVVTMADGDALALESTGKIDIAGSGSVVAGATAFSGAGAWTATLGAAATSITVTSGASGIGAAITAPSGSAASTLTASGTPVITQAAGTTGNTLDIGAFVTIDLKGTNSAPVGAIVMTEGADPATLTVADDTSKIMTANTGNVTPSVSSGSTGIVTGSNATGEIGASAANKFVVTAASATAADAYLVSITGDSTNTGGVLSAAATGSATPTINAAFCVDADGT
jgi:hypothetical protein